MQARAAGHLGPFDDSVAVLREHFTALRKQAADEKPTRVQKEEEKRRKSQ